MTTLRPFARTKPAAADTTGTTESARRKPARTVVAAAAAAAALSMVSAPALAAAPDPVALLSEYEDYWKPNATPAFSGNVTETGVSTLKQNDETLLKINDAGAADQTQAHRALVDADYDWKQTLPDALGPVLGKYFSEGVSAGKLPKTSKAITDMGAKATTGEAKKHYNYPRPYMDDRSLDGDNDLRGLDKKLDIHKIADWKDPETGKSHTADYAGLLAGKSQAFPSGHTTYAYQVGIELAMIIPQLGPEAVTRSSEAGNNRSVLGVHYPLDVMGGRILGHANSANIYSDKSYVEDTLKPAQKELADYLAKECADDGHGDTLEACIDDTKANDTGGYRNAFTDAVATSPVTNRASALKVYQQRMTYGFDKVATAKAAKAGAAQVPEDAEDLLATAFPTLNDEQRRAVIAATQIDSGYPLDSSSQGWQRVDLPAALSAKVTLDKDGNVTKVEPGQDRPSVVKAAEPAPKPTSKSPSPTTTKATPSQKPGDKPSAKPTSSTSAPAPQPGGNDNDNGNDNGSDDSDDNGSGPGNLPRTGVEVGAALAAGAVAIALGGALLALTRRRQYRNRH